MELSTNTFEQVSPVVIRGITTAGVNLGIVIGQLLSNAAIKGFGERSDRWAYRGPFAIQLFFVGTSQSRKWLTYYLSGK
jgi:hypothetical protein